MPRNHAPLCTPAPEHLQTECSTLATQHPGSALHFKPRQPCPNKHNHQYQPALVQPMRKLGATEQRLCRPTPCLKAVFPRVPIAAYNVIPVQHEKRRERDQEVSSAQAETRLGTERRRAPRKCEWAEAVTHRHGPPATASTVLCQHRFHRSPCGAGKRAPERTAPCNNPDHLAPRCSGRFEADVS